MHPSGIARGANEYFRTSLRLSVGHSCRFGGRERVLSEVIQTGVVGFREDSEHPLVCVVVWPAARGTKVTLEACGGLQRCSESSPELPELQVPLSNVR